MKTEKKTTEKRPGGLKKANRTRTQRSQKNCRTQKKKKKNTPGGEDRYDTDGPRGEVSGKKARCDMINKKINAGENHGGQEKKKRYKHHLKR